MMRIAGMRIGEKIALTNSFGAVAHVTFEGFQSNPKALLFKEADGFRITIYPCEIMAEWVTMDYEKIRT